MLNWGVAVAREFEDEAPTWLVLAWALEGAASLLGKAGAVDGISRLGSFFSGIFSSSGVVREPRLSSSSFSSGFYESSQ